MNKKNAQKQTQGTRTVQGVDIRERDSGSSSGADGVSGKDGVESVSSIREDREKRDSVELLVIPTIGKIIDRLIDSWRDRRQEASDCLDWYNDKVAKCDKEISSLEEIKADLQSQSEPEE